MRKRIIKIIILIIVVSLIGIIVRYLYIRSKHIKIRSKYLPITMEIPKDIGLEYYIYPYDKDIEKAEIKIFKDRRSDEDIKVDSIVYKYILDIKVVPILDKKPNDNYRYATRDNEVLIQGGKKKIDGYIKFLNKKIYRIFPKEMPSDNRFRTGYYEYKEKIGEIHYYYYPDYEKQYYFDMNCQYVPHREERNIKLNDIQNFASACDKMIESIKWIGWDMDYKNFEK